MNLPALKDQIETAFNLDELQSLSFDLGIQFENLAGTTRDAKARALIEHCQRIDRVSELISRCQELRPSVNWFEIAEISGDPALVSIGVWGGGNYMTISKLPTETPLRVGSASYVTFDTGNDRESQGLVILTSDRFLLLPLKKDVVDDSIDITLRSFLYTEIQSVDLPKPLRPWPTREKSSPWFVLTTKSGITARFYLSTITVPDKSFIKGVTIKLLGLVSKYTGRSFLARDLNYLNLVKPVT